MTNVECSSEHVTNLATARARKLATLIQGCVEVCQAHPVGKLPVSELVKTFPAFYCTRRFITFFTFVTIRSRIHPNRFRSILIVSPHRRFRPGLASGLLPKCWVIFFSLVCLSHYPPVSFCFMFSYWKFIKNKPGTKREVHLALSICTHLVKYLKLFALETRNNYKLQHSQHLRVRLAFELHNRSTTFT